MRAYTAGRIRVAQTDTQQMTCWTPSHSGSPTNTNNNPADKWKAPSPDYFGGGVSFEMLLNRKIGRVKLSSLVIEFPQL